MKKSTLLTIVAILSLISIRSHGQDSSVLFKYDDADPTVIIGLTEPGLAASTLTIPEAVKKIMPYAFSYAQATSLIFDGCDVVFPDEDGDTALDDLQGQLTKITMGSGMSVAHFTDVIEYLGQNNCLEVIDLSEFKPKAFDATNTTEAVTAEQELLNFQRIDWSDYLHTYTSIYIPAQYVYYQHFQIDDDVDIPEIDGEMVCQNFGSARVYGRFPLTNEWNTFCCLQNFVDRDDGSNFLFYIAENVVDRDNDGKNWVYANRVRYIMGLEGVLYRKVNHTATYADLLLYNPAYFTTDYYDPSSDIDDLYPKNLLVGVYREDQRHIEAYEVRNNVRYDNYVLYNGTFYPTTAGNMNLNRAYLQVEHNDNAANLTFSIYEMQEEDAIHEAISYSDRHSTNWYTIDGFRLDRHPSHSGIYIHQNRKVIVK